MALTPVGQIATQVVWQATTKATGGREYLSEGKLTGNASLARSVIQLPAGTYQIECHADTPCKELNIRVVNPGTEPLFYTVSQQNYVQAVVELQAGASVQFPSTTETPTRLWGVMRRIA